MYIIPTCHHLSFVTVSVSSVINYVDISNKYTNKNRHITKVLTKIICECMYGI